MRPDAVLEPVIDGEDEPFLGHKAHVVCDETGMATAVTVTPGDEAELPQLPRLLDELRDEVVRIRCQAGTCVR